MSWWRKAVEWVVTIALVLILAFAVLGSILVEDDTGFELVTIGFILFLGSLIKGCAVAFLRRRDGLYAAAVQDARATVRLSRPNADALAMLFCFWLAALGLGFVSLGAVHDSKPLFVPLAALAVFGGLAIVATWGFIRRGGMWLLLSPAGLQCRRFGDITIAWPDIRSADLIGVGKFNTLKVILLELVDEAKYLPRKKKPFWAWGDRMWLGTSFTIPLSLDVSSKLVLQAIKVRLSAFGSAADAHSAVKETR